MRTHPLGLICLWRTEEEAFEVAARLSRVTHVDPRCVVACVIGTALVRGVVRGEITDEKGVDDLITRAVDWFVIQEEQRKAAEKADPVDATEEKANTKADDDLDREELKKHVQAASLDELKLDDPPAIGYVYKTLGSGILLLRMAMRQTTSSHGSLLVQTRLFESLTTDLIMRGGDADTNACFAGALLGGFLGYKALPDHWKHGLRHGDWLMGKAEALSQVLGLTSGEYIGKDDKDTHPDGGRGFITQDQMEGRWMVLQQAAFKKMHGAPKPPVKEASRFSLPWRRNDRGS
jgi:hypothetical protein